MGVLIYSFLDMQIFGNFIYKFLRVFSIEKDIEYFVAENCCYFG